METTQSVTPELPTLPDIADAIPLTDADAALVNDIVAVLKKHSALSRFGITLLHQHFPIGQDEVLIETTDKSSRMQTIQPIKTADIEGLEAKETSWRLDTGKAVTACVCVIKGEHMHLPVQCDMRLKEGIMPLDSGLEAVLNLQAVRFKYTKNSRDLFGLPEGGRLGFLAQQVETVLPEAVQDGYRDTGHKAVDFGALVPVLVRAVQEQQKTIESLAGRIEALTQASA